LEADPVTAPIVGRIFADAAAGKPLRRIARELTADGIAKPSGNGLPYWHQTSVHCILTNPAYAGRAAGWRMATTRDRKHEVKKRYRRRLPDEQIKLPEGTIPPLVDATMFDAVQERLRLNHERSARRNRDPELTLLRGGYIRCGYCGNALITHRSGPYVRYRCTRRQGGIPDSCSGATIAASGRLRWMALAGTAAGLAFLFKQNVGAFAMLAVAGYVLLHRRTRAGRLLRVARALFATGLALIVTFFLHPGLEPLLAATLWLPLLATLAFLLRSERDGARPCPWAAGLPGVWPKGHRPPRPSSP
jgi:hypothetical protein